jgi:hypothetical protein
MVFEIILRVNRLISRWEDAWLGGLGSRAGLKDRVSSGIMRFALEEATHRSVVMRRANLLFGRGPRMPPTRQIPLAMWRLAQPVSLSSIDFYCVVRSLAMRGRCLGLACGVLLSAAAAAHAEEVAGRLERVDLATVTLRDESNHLYVVKVDGTHRQKAAPFLGRWVTVDCQGGHGEYVALGFRHSDSK